MRDKNEQNFAPIKQRIVQYLNFKEVKKEEFYSKINVAKSNFSKSALNSEVSASIVAKILNYFPDISAEWLITGKGDMMNNNKGTDVEAGGHKDSCRCQLCEEKDKRIEELKEQIEVLKDQVRILKKISNQ